jgi:hypothetical protein
MTFFKELLQAANNFEKEIIDIKNMKKLFLLILLNLFQILNSKGQEIVSANTSNDSLQHGTFLINEKLNRKIEVKNNDKLTIKYKGISNSDTLLKEVEFGVIYLSLKDSNLILYHRHEAINVQTKDSTKSYIERWFLTEAKTQIRLNQIEYMIYQSRKNYDIEADILPIFRAIYVGIIIVSPLLSTNYKNATMDWKKVGFFSAIPILCLTLDLAWLNEKYSERKLNFKTLDGKNDGWSISQKNNYR